MSRYFIGVLVAVSILLPAVASDSSDEVAHAFVESVDQFSLTVTIRPKRETQNLRSVGLRVSWSSGEPHAIWQNGKPMSASERISRDQALSVIALLNRQGFFKRAGKYYSDGNNNAKGPPPEGASKYADALANPPTSPGYALVMVLYDFKSSWITYYMEQPGTSRKDLELLRQLIRMLDEEPAELLSALERQID